ncbi:MAG: multifunctional CCA addition/repair protein [Neisseria sp.]|nr:multifunctional CCA addition/repair protein [Neisseria sp.]
MQTYLVGGAVRDRLLGRDTQDLDWVVVGANPQIMLAQGFLPVGKDFPVFLHPKTRQEYALARTERKIAQGYAGFAFYADSDVTLEQDLMRRDLTINAMAQAADGTIIDPFGGQDDLKNKCLRHVSPAFAEDPVRVLRTARFAARYDFEVAPETMQLMQNMVAAGECHALVAERVWQELAKGLCEPFPAKMIEILRESGCLKVISPELEQLFGVPQNPAHHPEIDAGIHTLLVLQQTAVCNLSLAERYAALLHDLGKGITPKNLLPKHRGHDLAGVPLVQAVNQRLRAPKACAELAELVCRWHIVIHSLRELSSEQVLDVLRQTDALRRPERFEQLLNVCRADSQGRLHHENAPYPQHEAWQNLLAAIKQVPQKSIAQQHQSQPQHIAQAIYQAQLAAIEAVHQPKND